MQIVDSVRLAAVTARARTSPRLRMNDNLHAMEDPVHRLLNATEPGTYVQPHRHSAPPRVETLAVLAGRGAVLLFDDAGRVSDTVVLSPAGPAHVVEIPGGAWHTLLALEPGTVWFEVKAGPYQAPPPEDVASWAPPPSDARAAADYLATLLRGLPAAASHRAD
jgi:cupin fold WbuC family metalloprotein